MSKEKPYGPDSTGWSCLLVIAILAVLVLCFGALGLLPLGRQMLPEELGKLSPHEAEAVYTLAETLISTLSKGGMLGLIQSLPSDILLIV